MDDVDTIGELIDKLHAKRKEIADHRERERELKRQEEDIEARVIDAMERQDTTQGAGKLAQARVSDRTMPQVIDWDKFYQFIHQNRFYHLLQRRPSSTGCQELFDNQGSIPGVERFSKKQINLRSL
jgi:hypothetical protein